MQRQNIDITPNNNIKYNNKKSENYVQDTNSLKSLIDEFSGLVNYIVYNVIKNIGTSQDIEECVSDIFLFVWENIKKYDSNKGSFRSWIAVISRSRAIDLWRKLEKRNETYLSENLIGNNSIEKIFLDKEIKENLINAIKSLGEPDTKIFLNRFFYFESIDSIARKLNLSRQAVDNRLWRGKKKIRELLKEGGISV